MNTVALLIFYLDNLSIDVSAMLKSPIIIVLLSISPFMFVYICGIGLGVLVLGTYMLISVVSSVLVTLSLYNIFLCLLW